MRRRSSRHNTRRRWRSLTCNTRSVNDGDFLFLLVLLSLLLLLLLLSLSLFDIVVVALVAGVGVVVIIAFPVTCHVSAHLKREVLILPCTWCVHSYAMLTLHSHYTHTKTKLHTRYVDNVLALYAHYVQTIHPLCLHHADPGGRCERAAPRSCRPPRVADGAQAAALPHDVQAIPITFRPGGRCLFLPFGLLCT